MRVNKASDIKMIYIFFNCSIQGLSIFLVPQLTTDTFLTVVDVVIFLLPFHAWLFVCRICQSLESSEHGYIHGQQFWEGEHASFSCRPAYWLEGYLVRRCLKTGTWTGNQPRCILLGRV